MALTTKTIRDTINWAKRFSFERNPVIGNSLEPALTSANMVLQTLLSPPLNWWWNSQELVFTCNPTPNSATSTVISISGGVLTVTAANTFAVGNLLLPSAVATLTTLNGQIIEVASLIGSAPTFSGFTANVTLADGSDTVGTFTNVTTQDYTLAVPNFSHIEHASVLDLTPTLTSGVFVPAKWWELTVKNNLSLESSANRPNFIGPHVEDANGNITFRLASAPDKPYPVSLHIQNAAPAIVSMNQTWAPLPDFMEYIYEWGFLALMWQFADDPRAADANNKFKAGILARAEGLTEEERNIFLNNWEALYMNPQTKQMGTQARAM
jgi:hypothetical protein